MRKIFLVLPALMMVLAGRAAGDFPLVTNEGRAAIYTDAADYQVVQIAAGMLADDVERVTGCRPIQQTVMLQRACIVAGTLGHSPLADQLVSLLKVDVSSIRDKWESHIMMTTTHPEYHTPLLLIIGSDRRGTAFALTSLSETIGVSSW